ncbi:MAG: class I SAM-dependent methyltransferase [Campylobacterota bacterium]|nr:class I SAM-dependent methyltransferase [Campylobacterota bacterium]
MSISIDELKHILETKSSDLSAEFKRIFHGRGGLYDQWRHLTIDSIDNILSIYLYFENDNESLFLEMIKEFIKNSRHNTVVVQRRYKSSYPSEVIVGELEDDIYILENGVKIYLNLLTNKNNGYFPDMKNGRAFVKENAKDKKVLNLFSYTCAFSLFASLGEAKSVINIDMSKSALSTGRKNHHLNNIDTKNISFLPHNILKSFGRIKRDGPYGLIIIDPPTFQKGSFEATKDYSKIIKKLYSIATPNCIVLACLNSPDLNSEFIIDLFSEFAPEFEFVKQLDNLEEFKALDEQRSLKNLVFRVK